MVANSLSVFFASGELFYIPCGTLGHCMADTASTLKYSVVSVLNSGIASSVNLSQFLCNMTIAPQSCYWS